MTKVFNTRHLIKENLFREAFMEEQKWTASGVGDTAENPIVLGNISDGSGTPLVESDSSSMDEAPGLCPAPVKRAKRVKGKKAKKTGLSNYSPTSPAFADAGPKYAPTLPEYAPTVKRALANAGEILGRHFMVTVNMKYMGVETGWQSKGKLQAAEMQSLLATAEDVRYAIFQLERGEEGTPHWQMYVEFKKNHRMPWVRKFFKDLTGVKAHVEKRNGPRDKVMREFFMLTGFTLAVYRLTK